MQRLHTELGLQLGFFSARDTEELDPGLSGLSLLGEEASEVAVELKVSYHTRA